MTTDKLTITAAKALAAFTDAAVFASDEAQRPTLYAVQVMANGDRCQLVGSDSYVLGTFTFDGDGTMSALIAIDDVKRIVALAKAEIKVYRAGATELVFERTDNCLEVRGRETTLTMRLVPGEYPAWRSLFDRVDTSTNRGAYSAYVLAKLGKVTLGFKSTKRSPDRPPMRFELNGPKPAHLELEHDGIVFVGLAMPVRVNDDRPVADPERIEPPAETEKRLGREAKLAELAADTEDDGETHFPNGTVDHEGPSIPGYAS